MKILTSNTTKGSIAVIFKEIKKRLDNNEDCIILTADRSVANMEVAVLENLKGCGAEFRVNVMSFTRFCVKNMGDKVKECLTPEGSVMLLADVISKVNKNFHYYRRVRPDSLANEVYAALTALRNSGISTEMLRKKGIAGGLKDDEKKPCESETATKLPDSLRRKLHDLVLIYEGYLEALGDKREDSTTRLEAFVNMLNEDCGKNKGINFFVVGMEDFNKPQLDVLKALDNGAKSLTIGLVDGKGNKNCRVYPGKLIDKIKRLSGDNIVESFEGEHNLDDVQLSIVKNLFAYEKLMAREIVDAKGRICINEALTRQDEVLYVALDIVKKIRAGARYKDFEILVGSEDYIPIIRNIFDRYGIVYFVDQKEMLIRQTKVKYLLCGLQTVIKNFRGEDVIDLVKNPLFALTLEDGTMSKNDKIFRFENYVLKYNITSFNKPFEIGDKKEIEVAEEVRQILVGTLEVLGGNNKKPMDEIVKNARTFLDNVAPQWAEHVEILSKESKHYKKCAEQVDNKMSAIFDEIKNVLNEESNLESFDTILRSMFKTLKIALVPTSVDTVFVGDMSSKFTGRGNLYVVGANSGYLPSESAGGVILTASDEQLFETLLKDEEIEGRKVELYPTQKDRVKKERRTIIEILAGCKGQISISYSVSSHSGAMRPSEIVLQLKAMFKEPYEEEGVKKYRELSVSKIDFDNIKKTMASPEDLSYMFAGKDKGMHSILTYAESGRASESEMPIYRSAYDNLDSDDQIVFEKIRKEPEWIKDAPVITKTSLSRLEQYFKCPYGYFLNYTLGLKERKEGNVESFDAGLILHAVFEKFFKKLNESIDKETNTITLKREDVEGVALSAYDSYMQSEGNERLLRLYEKPDVKRMFDRIKLEGVRTCKDFYEIALHSRFLPEYFEAEFIGEEEAKRKYGDDIDERALFKPIILDNDGKQVEIRGFIDRVDVCDDNFLIFDYKTYNKDLADKEIYYGESLQLYIYAKAMEENIGKKPAGVFYVPIRVGFTKGAGVKCGYNGHTTDNAELRGKIFGDVQDGATSDYDQNPIPEHYLDEDGFKARSEYALDLATEGVKEIEAGYIKPSPLGNCTNCYYKKYCVYSGIDGRSDSAIDVGIFTSYKNAEETDADSGKDNGEVEE